MVWIFAVVAVVLVTIIVEMLIVYQKKALHLRMRQEPLHRRIEEHLRSMEEATQKIRQTVAHLLEELDYEVERHQAQTEMLKEIFSRLEADRSEETRGGEEGEEGEDGAEIGGATEEEEETNRLLTEAQHRQEEIGSHFASLKREREIIERTMERIETRIQRRLDKQAQRRSGRQKKGAK